MNQRMLMSNRMLIAMLTLVASLAAAPPAAAQFGVDSFFSTGDARADWADAGAPGSVIELRVAATPPGGSPGAAMVRFTGFSSSLPAESPTYDFRASATGSSGGSPRLTLRLSNGGAELRPLQVVADQWTTMDGQSNWDNYGGSCGFLSGISYAEVVRCHDGETVVNVEIWNDSGWLYPDGYGVLIDNVRYAAEQVSSQQDDTIMGPVEPPVIGTTVTVARAEGTVKVRLPEADGGTGFQTLPAAADIPVGSVVDTTDGKVQLTSVVDRDLFMEGDFSRGLFRIVKQPLDASITELRMKGRLLRPCRSRHAHAAVLGRALWSDVRRRRRGSHARAAAPAIPPANGIRVVAAHSTATADDAAWRTRDRCDGTLTRVTRGKVFVRDLATGRSALVRAGHTHLARR